ncbi:MAG: hypothetical protein UT01_C0012G0012 [Candidatus Daviesbacteria bacterium GW2011_GWA1_38_7]|nr:MAG: hypothetical protein UT01_C0012G0012 [Candidatus Daviesbacteria bacterium GW2011_GWA1_38_7]
MCIMNDQVFEQEETLKKAEVVGRLRKLADGIETGTLTLENGGKKVSVNLPESLEYELELDEEREDVGMVRTLSLEIEWSEGKL